MLGCEWHDGGLWRNCDVINSHELTVVREGLRRGLADDLSAQQRQSMCVIKHLHHLVIDPIPSVRVAALDLFSSIGPRAKIPAPPASGGASGLGLFTRLGNETMILVFDVLHLHHSWMFAKTCKRLWHIRSEAAVAERAPVIHAVAKMLEDGPPQLHTEVRAHPTVTWGEPLAIEVRPSMLAPRMHRLPVGSGIVDLVPAPWSRRVDPGGRKMGRLIKLYCEKTRVERRSVQFEVEGRRIEIGDSFEDIGLRSNDSIGVRLQDEHRRQALWVLLGRCDAAERDPYEHLLLHEPDKIWYPEGACPDDMFWGWRSR